MTIALALLDRGRRAIVAADRTVLVADSVKIEARKIVQRGHAIFAISGDLALRDIVEELRLNGAPRYANAQWVREEILPHVIKAAKAREVDGDVLLVARDRSGRRACYSFDIESGALLDGPEIVIGAGSEVALGALYATRGEAAEHRAKTAIAAAKTFSASCGGRTDLVVL